MKETIVLVDADILAYKIGYACEKKTWTVSAAGVSAAFEGKAKLNAFVKETGLDINKCEVTHEEHVEPVSHALYSTKMMLESIKDRTKTTSMVIVLSGGASWREQVALRAPYKANRWSPERIQAEKGSGFWSAWLADNEGKIHYQQKPTHWQAIRDYLVEYHGAVITKGGLEADDYLGMASTQLKDEGDIPIIATIDKDMRQIPGLYYHLDSKELTDITEEGAMDSFYIQLMAGDRTDNIPGITGVGSETAQKFLDDAKEHRIPPLTQILDLYVTRAKWEGCENPQAVGLARMNETATLVWILRHPNTPWYGETENKWAWRGLTVHGGAILEKISWTEKGVITTKGFFTQSEPAEDTGSLTKGGGKGSPGSSNGEDTRKGSSKPKA